METSSYEDCETELRRMQTQVASAQALTEFTPFVFSHQSVGGDSGLVIEQQARNRQLALSPALGRNPAIQGLDTIPFCLTAQSPLYHNMPASDKMTTGQSDIYVPNTMNTDPAVEGVRSHHHQSVGGETGLSGKYPLSGLLEDQKSLRLKVNQLAAENKRLSCELKSTVQHQLDACDVDELPVETGVVDAVIVGNLEHQLQNALREKESVTEMWQAATAEIETLEAQLQKLRSCSSIQAMETKAKQIKHQYDCTVTHLNTEISHLQEELCKSQSASNAANIQVVELRRALEEVRDQLVKQERDRLVASGSKERADTKVTQMQKEFAACQSKVDEMTTELSRVTNERDTLERRLKKVQVDCAEHETRECEATMKVRDSIQMVENAMLEKDEAFVREKQVQQEIARMKTTIQRLIVQAAARTRSEVDIVRKQCNENLSRLMEELENLEMINGERQAQIDRAIREKRAVEAELEKLYQEGLVQGSKDMSSREDLVRRACNAERSRDEAIAKLDSMRSEMERLKNTSRDQKEALKVELNTLHDRLSHMTQEFELGAEERINLIEQIDQLKRNEIILKQERDNAARKLTKQLAVMQTEMMQRTREFEVKHQTIEDSHRLTIVELREMLSSQQRMCSKWKEECQLVTSKFEAQISDLRGELADQKRRNDELVNLLRESKDRTLQAEQLLIEYNRNIKRMESRVRDAEQRAANAMVQSTAHNRSERSLVEQRREMKRQLERSLRESSITVRENKDACGALMLSDLTAQPSTPPRPNTSNGLQMSNGEIDTTR
ncbi:Sodium channel and clathrin linker 1 [Lamellibrachia satsuma]|nr:Sodium channel and clathrin linker 1 [Lamellibrachia satsuma]